MEILFVISVVLLSCVGLAYLFIKHFKGSCNCCSGCESGYKSSKSCNFKK
ncbi:MAG: hypothetical protein PHT81_03925 [Endomicrobiaceae bacterium]|nr:hypothetical protein [Endomicrobiaceae bacterium]